MSNDWLIWQLVDSAFPTGGFAHSSGLESARNAGQIPDESALERFVLAAMRQAAHSALPYTCATHTNPMVYPEANSHCNALLANPVVNRASCAQGSGLLTVAAKAFSCEPIGALNRQSRAEGNQSHYAPVFGVIFAHLGVSLDATKRMFLFLTVRGILSAAIRLNIVGPLRAQWMQNRFSDEGDRLILAGIASDFYRVAQTSPLIDMWQSSHNRLYSRLFQS